MKRILKWIGVFGLVVGVGLGIFYALYVRPLMNYMLVMHTIHVDPQLTIVLGGGGNGGIVVGDSAILVVETKMGSAAQPFYDSVKQLAGNKPIYVVNTHVHTDHNGGNKLFSGKTIIAGGDYDKDFWINDAGAESLPNKWVKDSLVIDLGGDSVTILNMGFAAHTQSDVVVYVHKQKTLFTGDLVLDKQAPGMFGKYNSSAEGYLKAFDLLEKRFDIKTIVPGHGEKGGLEVIDAFRQYIKDMQAVAANGSLKSTMEEKYKNWRQVPFFMSTGATVRNIKSQK